MELDENISCKFFIMPSKGSVVQCTDNEVCTDTFCTDGESDIGGLVIRNVPLT